MLLSHLLQRATNTLRHSPSIYCINIEARPRAIVSTKIRCAKTLNSSSFITAEKASAFHKVDHSSPEDLHVGRSALDISVSLSAIGIFVLPTSGSVKVSTQLATLPRSIRIFMKNKNTSLYFYIYILYFLFFFFWHDYIYLRRKAALVPFVHPKSLLIVLLILL